MKKVFLFILLLLPATLFFTACDEVTPDTITVPDNQNLTPVVLADETAPAAPVKFTTKAAWSSSIVETPAAGSTRAAVPDWITISPDYGDKAGNYSVTISLAVNTTGQERKAVITILCDGEQITITVTQKATDKNGEVPKPAGNTLTYDGNTYTVTKTEFGAGVPYILSEGIQTYRHLMKFYFDSDRYLEMLFVTDRQQFSGGGFKFGDTQINPLNKVAGLIVLPAAAGGTGIADNIEWRHDLRAVRASDNTLTVEFDKVQTNLGKEAGFKFTGPFTNTGSTDFVPVQNIDFPATSELSVGMAPLNTVCYLSYATVTPANSTNRLIEWSVQNASIQNISIEESRITFDKTGTATITATIRNGKLDADGATPTDYTQTWTVTVNDISSGSVTWDSTNYPITKTEIGTGVRHVTPEGVTTSFYRHDMKFYISSAQYVKLSFFTSGETFSGGEFNMVSSFDASVTNPVTGQFNFAVATGEVRNLTGCNTKVVAVRQSNNNFTLDFQGAYYEGGGGLSLHYEGEYKSTDNGGGPVDPVDPNKVITFNGTDRAITKAEYKIENWMSDDGAVTAKSHLMTFYMGSTLYAKVRIINNADEISNGSYQILREGAVGRAQAEFNFTIATGATDYAKTGGSVSIVNNSDGTKRVEFTGITTAAAGLSVGLLYVGKFDETTTGPGGPVLGQMTASVTGSTYDLTGCAVTFDFQTELMRVVFTGKDCDLWFETYVNHTEEGKAPLLNGTYVVDYLDDDGSDWGERFNNKATSSRVHAVSNHINWGDWSSGLREGTQIVVSMNDQKINATIKDAHINGLVEYQGNMLINLVYDGAYTR